MRLKKLVGKQFHFSSDDSNDVAKYGFVVNETPMTLHMASTTICHAGLRNPRVPNGKQCVAIVSQVFQAAHMDAHELTEDVRTSFYNWLLRDSPFSKAFYSKMAHAVFRNRYVVLRTDVPWNLLVAACIATRYLWEEIKVPRAWFDLVAEGVDKNEAFVLAHMIYHGYRSYDFTRRRARISLQSHNSNHSVFNGNAGTHLLENFCENTPIGLANGTFKTGQLRSAAGPRAGESVCGIFQEVDNQYWAQPKEGLLKALENLVSEEAKAMDDGKNLNIFAAAGPVRAASTYTYEQLIKVIAKVAPLLKEKVYAKGKNRPPQP